MPETRKPRIRVALRKASVLAVLYYQRHDYHKNATFETPMKPGTCWELHCYHKGKRTIKHLIVIPDPTYHGDFGSFPYDFTPTP